MPAPLRYTSRWTSWYVPLACNTRRVRIYSDRVRVANGPIPAWFPRHIPRAQIHRCYPVGAIRTIASPVWSPPSRNSSKYPVPSLRPPPPLQPGHRPLEIRWIYDIPASSWRMLALLSMALFLAAYPELNRNHRNADPRKLEIPL